MYLVIGGQAQGKLAWVKEHFNIDDTQIIDGSVLNIAKNRVYLGKCTVLYNLQELLKRSMQQNCTESIVSQLLQLPPHTIIICNDVGAGLVPLEEAERQWRDLVGRTCCQLAVAADEVWRIFCGLPQQIK